MYKNNTISVVVPAHNEEKLIEKVICTMPDYVDWIVVINDASTDNTSQMIHSLSEDNNKLICIDHAVNQGVGGAIASGYRWSRDHDVDIAAVMAGDAQMDPDDLSKLLDVVIDENIDYAKGNRFTYGNAWKAIPKIRFMGNAVLSLLTKITSGYWHIADSQTGFTAINKAALKRINWDKMYKRYGQPNDLLVRLNVENFKVRDVPIKPVYNVGEVSGIKIQKVFFTIPWLLLKLFLWRLKEKYIIRDTHPLVFFYLIGFLFSVLSFFLFVRVFYYWLYLGELIPSINALAAFFSFMSGTQFILFGMWFDMESNKELK